MVGAGDLELLKPASFSGGRSNNAGKGSLLTPAVSVVALPKAQGGIRHIKRYGLHRQSSRTCSRCGCILGF